MLALAQVELPGLAGAVFVLAVGVAHAFVATRYLVAAAAATVMALIQGHLAHPQGGYGIGERLADTLIGAMLAWAFCYLLPWWERRGLEALIDRLMRGLAGLAAEALHWPGDAAAELRLRLARREAYDAMGGIAAAAQRTAVEPRRVQLPLYGLATLLSQSHLLLAHLSSTRTLLLRRGDEFDRAAAEAVLVAASDALQQAVQTRPGAPNAPLATTLPDELPPTDAPLLHWLQRRLQLARQAALRAADAVRVVRASLPPG